MTATIDPVATNSSILVVVTGSGSGAYGGNSSGQQATGYSTLYKNGSAWSGIDIFLQKGNPQFKTPISQAMMDNSNHGGNSVSYSVMLRRYMGGVNVSISANSAISLFEVFP